MSREKSPQRGKPGLRTILAAVAAMLAATACFVGCLAEVAALGSEHEAPTAVLIAAAAAFAVGAVVLIRAAIHLEHRFRGPQPAAGATAAPAAVRRTPVRHPRNGPASRIFAIALGIGALAVVTTSAVQLHSQAVRSSYTQHHGLARHATVESVQPVNHATSHDSWTTYNYEVTLAVPAGAVTHTVANDPTRDFQRFNQGDTVSVLVDPRQLDYAELPGIPVESSWWFAGPLTLAVLFLAVTALIAAEQIRHRRLRGAGLPSRSADPVPSTADPSPSR